MTLIKKRLEEQISELERIVGEFPKTQEEYSPENHLENGVYIIFLEKEIENGIRVYTKRMEEIRGISYNPEEDPLVKSFEELKLSIAENEILEKIKGKYDPDYVYKKLLGEMLQKRQEENNNGSNTMYI